MCCVCGYGSRWWFCKSEKIDGWEGPRPSHSFIVVNSRGREASKKIYAVVDVYKLKNGDGKSEHMKKTYSRVKTMKNRSTSFRMHQI